VPYFRNCQGPSEWLFTAVALVADADDNTKLLSSAEDMLLRISSEIATNFHLKNITFF
jgi:hypothetical protein